MNVDPQTLLLLASLLAAAGAAAGFLAGLMGVGGGIVMVPALYAVFTALGVDEAVRVHMSVATSLAVIIPTSIRSVMSHRAKGAVDFDLLRVWLGPTFLGAIIGAVLADLAPGTVLGAVFVVGALAAALNLAARSETSQVAERLPGQPWLGLMALGNGVISTLMGIGGGTFGVLMMTLFGKPIHKAVGTASGLGVLIALPATIGYVIAGWDEAGRAPLSLGYVNGAGFLIVAAATFVTTPYGVKAAHALPRARLRLAFAGFLALSALLMLREVIG